MTRGTTGFRLSETFRTLLERALGPDGDLVDAVRAYAYLGAAGLGTLTSEHERELARLLGKDLAPEVKEALRAVYNTCATCAAQPLHQPRRPGAQPAEAAVPAPEPLGNTDDSARDSTSWEAVGIEV
jgi:hypothetical protein